VIVVDSSVLANVVADDTQEGDLARERLGQAASLHAPDLVYLEVLSVLRRRAASGNLDERRSLMAREDLRDLPMQSYPHRPLIERVWELRRNVTAYDAAYLALAELLGCPLLTADGRLAGAPGVSCQVEVLRTR
jgi:predicted nucleic acid-binding protein